MYTHTKASAIFRTDQAASFFRLGFVLSPFPSSDPFSFLIFPYSTIQFPQWWRVSDYLKCHTAADAKDATKIPFSWAMGKEGLTYYETLEEDPAISDAWHKGMVLIEATQPVCGMFPFSSLREEVEAEPERPFVVDVGGGRGNALVAIMGECGGSFGAKMVLQDMEAVLNGKDPVSVDGVDVMAHNFYNPQPVKSTLDVIDTNDSQKKKERKLT